VLKSNETTPVVFYDVTRLITRQSWDTPTGVDRVDLRYVEFLLNNRSEDLVFVRQRKNEFVLVDSADIRALTEHLEQKWASVANVDGTLSADDEAAQELVHSRRTAESLRFRMTHFELTDPDLGSFFSLPYRERFNFLLKQDVGKNVGPELSWVNSFPYIFRIGYAFGASSCRPAAKFFVKCGQLIGFCLHSGNLKRAVSTILKRSSDEMTLETHLRKQYSNGGRKRRLYVNTSGYMGMPLRHLKQLKSEFEMQYIFFVHDLLAINYPEYFIADMHIEHENRIQALLRLDALLIANSKTTEGDIHSFASARSLGPARTKSSPIGVEQHFIWRDQNTNQESAPYFVTVSTIEPRKNHLLLLNIWRQLTQLSISVPKLLVIGKRGWENENVIDMLERSPSLQGVVIEKPDLNDVQLIRLLRGARALLYPSFCEGWGMPVVESLALGTPAICSDISALRESGQDIPDYIDPLDGKKWMETIINYCDVDSSSRNQQMARIGSFRPPTWDEHFRSTLGELFEDSDSTEIA